MAVFLCRTERDNKIENLHLPRKSEIKRKAVVLERTGFYHNLRWNHSVGCDTGELLERPAFCGDCLLCVSLTSGRRNCDLVSNGGWTSWCIYDGVDYPQEVQDKIDEMEIAPYDIGEKACEKAEDFYSE